MLHLATTTRTLVKAEMRTQGAHSLGRLLVHHRQSALVETGFAAMHPSAHHFVGQGAVNKHHLPILAVRNTLALKVQALNRQMTIPVGRCLHHRHV